LSDIEGIIFQDVPRKEAKKIPNRQPEIFFTFTHPSTEKTMNIKSKTSFLILAGIVLLFSTALSLKGKREPTSAAAKAKRYLYVAVPGIRNYLEYGGHGILVFDIADNYKLVKRIPTGGLKDDGTPSNVKGVGVSIATNSIYISTLEALQRVDLATEKVVWEKRYEGGCDRFSVSPDGKTIYLPTLEKEHWNVVNAETGEVIKQITTNSGAHNTLYGSDGTKVYMAGLRTPTLGVSDTRTHSVIKQVGPFAAAIRPFTVNGSQTRCYVNVNGLLGFEIGDMTTGQKIHHIEVEGFKQGPVKRHGCPSHGIGLTPNEKEVWICDAFNQRMHIFDNTVMPPKQVASIEVRDQPGWITFSLDGKHAYPSTGEIIDIKTRKIITALKDEKGNPVMSEKLIEVHMDGRNAVNIGDQFGIGRAEK
jgi:DNA-binding beta-propeller fold protein YncE